ncbi:DUF2628 domain-containing protein, partial [Sedimentitalea sp. JM2-8]
PMSITPSLPDRFRRGSVFTWVNSQWKIMGLPGHFSAEINRVERLKAEAAATKIEADVLAENFNESTGVSWLWAFLFGPIYFAVHGFWGRAVLVLVLNFFIIGFIVSPFLAYALAGPALAMDYQQEGHWHSEFDDQTCLIWTEMDGEPQTRIWFFGGMEAGVMFSVRTQEWFEYGAPSIPFNPDSLPMFFIFPVPPSTMAPMNVVVTSDGASLVKKYQERHYKRVRGLMEDAAKAGVDIGIIDDHDAPLGRFSTRGLIEMLARFDACLEDKA